MVAYCIGREDCEREVKTLGAACPACAAYYRRLGKKVDAWVAEEEMRREDMEMREEMLAIGIL